MSSQIVFVQKETSAITNFTFRPMVCFLAVQSYHSCTVRRREMYFRELHGNCVHFRILSILLPKGCGADNLWGKGKKRAVTTSMN